MKRAAMNLLGFCCVAATALLFALSPAAERADHALLDLQFRLLRDAAPGPAADRVAVVGIDERTFAAYPEPLALWHPHLGALFAALADARPALVLLDVVLPDRSYDFLVPGHDRALLAGLLALRRASPLVLAQTVDDAGRLRRVFPPIVSIAGPESLALPLLTPDPDGSVRRFAPDIVTEQGAFPTLAGRAAERLGLPVEGTLIDYASGGPFGYLPFHRVVEWHQAGDVDTLRDAVAGRIVVVGSVLPYADRHRVPVSLSEWEPASRWVPGALVHAQVLRSLAGGGLVREAPRAAVLALVLAGCAWWWLGARPLAGLAALLVALAASAAYSTRALAADVFWPGAGVAFAATLGLAARSAFEGVRAWRQRRRLERSFGPYVSPTVLEEILAGTISPRVGGQRRRVCVLFSDIRSFTDRSQSQSPEHIISLLNRYFDEMTAAVHEHHGTIDKFIGDGLMAFFGAPKPLERPAAAAFEAARDMLRRLEVLNARLEREGVEPIRIGVGLHVGEAIVGHVGSESRHEYTAIGDTVNVASRLEGLTKELGCPVVMSANVADELEGDLQLVRLGAQPIKGHQPVPVLGWRGAGGAEAR